MESFSRKLKEAVYKSYARPAILYKSEALCLKERDENFTKDTDP